MAKNSHVSRTDAQLDGKAEKFITAARHLVLVRKMAFILLAFRTNKLDIKFCLIGCLEWWVMVFMTAY